MPITEVEDSFVGRERESAELEAALAGAVAGSGGLVLVSGEAGIGKTRLVEELARHASADGVRVAWGRSWEGGGAPLFWPWVEILRPLAEPPSADGAVMEDLDRLLGVSMPPEPRGDALPEFGEEHERFRLFDAVTRFLARVARDRPLLLAFDDLHAADPSTLLLLEFAASRLRATRVLVVGTCRTFEAVRDPELGRAFGRLARQARRIVLGGLSELDVARYAKAGFRLHLPERSVAALHHATAGNPFFLDELLRLLVAEGGTLGPERLTAEMRRLPHGLREAVERRLEGFAADERAILSTAAAIGREFDLDLLEASSGSSRPQLLAALADAEAARVVVPVADAIGRWRFSHGIVRNALLESLGAAERAERHRRIAEALAARAQAGGDLRLDEIAGHLCEAAILGEAIPQAIDYSIRAADGAVARLAYEDAARHYRRALELFERARPDEPRRCRCLIGLGYALARGGDARAAQAVFAEAAELARRLDLPRRLAEAALGCSMAYLWIDFGRRDEALQRLLEEALERLGDSDPGLRAALLARLAIALHWTKQAGRRRELGEQAVAIARRTGATTFLAYALCARHVAEWAPENAEERLAIADEIVQVAESSRREELGLYGRIFRVADRVELGDLAAAKRDVAEYAMRAERLRQPFYLWHLVLWRGMLAMLEGRFADAERLSAEALEIGRGSQQRNAAELFGVQTFVLRCLQGRPGDLEPMVITAIEEHPANRAWRCALAYVHAETGREEQARLELERLAERDFAGLPRDAVWLVGVALLARVCARLGDARRARVLYEQAQPFASRNVVIAPAAAMYGTMSQHLGVLAATAGLLDEAERHFADAIARTQRMRAAPFLALAESDLAALRRDGGDPRHRHAAAAVLRRASGPSAAPEQVVFRRSGDYWTIIHAGRAYQLRHTVGLEYVARLLDHPDAEFHVLDLAAPADRSAVPEASARLDARDLSVAAGDPGLPIHDAEARRAYRDRLADLREELREAQAFNDPGRAERAEAEIALLADELARARGLGGRERRTAAGAERARINVTKRIKLAIRKIAEHDPSLGRYLATTLRTGTFCAYSPDPRIPVSWRFE